MKKLLLVIAVIALIVFFTTVFTVDERQQVVILQLGKPVRTLQEPGLHFKLPVPFQNAVT